jgi:hypothetical protein
VEREGGPAPSSDSRSSSALETSSVVRRAGPARTTPRSKAFQKPDRRQIQSLLGPNSELQEIEPTSTTLRLKVFQCLQILCLLGPSFVVREGGPASAALRCHPQIKISKGPDNLQSQSLREPSFVVREGGPARTTVRFKCSQGLSNHQLKK